MATQEKEMKAISRELHDSVVPSVTALIWEVATPRGQIPENDAKAHETLDSIQCLAKAASAQIRDLALLLRPSMLDDLGLTAAIRWLVREVSRRTGLAIEISDDEISEDLPEGLSLCLYRLTQEALQNAVRHAQARTVYVELRRFRDRLLLSVRDDGTWFEQSRASSRATGHGRTEERLRQVGGALRITSRRGTDATVSAEIPLASPESYASSLAFVGTILEPAPITPVAPHPTSEVNDFLGIVDYSHNRFFSLEIPVGPVLMRRILPTLSILVVDDEAAVPQFPAEAPDRSELPGSGGGERQGGSQTDRNHRSRSLDHEPGDAQEGIETIRALHKFRPWLKCRLPVGSAGEGRRRGA